MTRIPFNIPLLSIPLYYIIATWPHVHSINIATKNNPNLKEYDNRNPHGTQNLAGIKSRLAPREFAAYERARNCHRNALENSWLFIGALFAGMIAENKAGEGKMGLTTFCIGWLLSRVLFTVFYLYGESMNVSLVRTVMYNVGVIYAFWVIGRASWVLGN